MISDCLIPVLGETGLVEKSVCVERNPTGGMNNGQHPVHPNLLTQGLLLLILFIPFELELCVKSPQMVESHNKTEHVDNDPQCI